MRRNAVKLLTKLVDTHPFSLLHGGQLVRDDWRARLGTVQEKLDSLDAQMQESLLLHDVSTASEEPKEIVDQQNEVLSPRRSVQMSEDEVARLRLTQRYYAEAIRFIDSIHDASNIVCQLLLSKNKTEVIESMDFFVLLDAYGIQCAKVG